MTLTLNLAGLIPALNYFILLGYLEHKDHIDVLPRISA